MANEDVQKWQITSPKHLNLRHKLQHQHHSDFWWNTGDVWRWKVRGDVIFCLHCNIMTNVLTSVLISFFYNMLSYPCWLQLTVTISFLLRQLSRVTSPWPQLSKLFQAHHTALSALILRVCCNSTPSIHACAHLKWHHGTPECVTHHIMGSR